MVQIFAGSAHYPAEGARPVVSIGNFDGVHKGHVHLIEGLRSHAAALEAPSLVYTFEPPPRVILAPQQARHRILAWPEKVRLLGEAGVDQVVVERFTRAFAQHPAEWFVHEVLGRRLRAQALVVGYDFRFGKARAGDLHMLRRLLPNTRVEQVDAHAMAIGEGPPVVVSSSAIRSQVLEGAVAEAAALLGRPHTISGTVVAGDKRGRSIGFPTANLAADAELLPADGVYAVRARANRGPWLSGVANLGQRPTFDGGARLLEVHLLDFGGDLYGAELEVAFIARIRSEARFDGIDALVAQIRKDVVAARVLLEAPGPRG